MAGFQYGPMDASVEGSTPGWISNRTGGLANAIVGKLSGSGQSFGDLYNQGFEQKAQLRERMAQQHPDATLAGQIGGAALLTAIGGKGAQNVARARGAGNTYTPNAPVANPAPQTGFPGGGMSAMPAPPPIPGGAVPLSEGLSTMNMLRSGGGAVAAASGGAVRAGLGAAKYGAIPAVGLGAFLAARGLPGGAKPDNGKYAGFDQGPVGNNYTTSPVRQQSADEALARVRGAPAAGQAGGGQDGAMFPGDDPSATLRVRLLLAKMSPRPHYSAAADQAGMLAMRLAQERYANMIKRAGGDQTLLDEAEAQRLAAISGIAKSGGVWGQMGLAAQRSQDDGGFW